MSTTSLNKLPVIIDTPGEYLTRDGRKVTIDTLGANSNDITNFPAKGSIWKMFRGKIRPREYGIWHISGRYFPLWEMKKDIVSKLSPSA